MGINVVYWVRDSQLAAAAAAPNPYETKVDTKGVLNHGHLPENEDYGGELPVVGPDPATLPDGQQSGGPFTIADYFYNGADFRLPGALGRPPVVNQGQSFTFKLSEFDIQNEVWHSLTSCKAPCNKSTGISYPIPDGEFQFESGQMGPGVRLVNGQGELSSWGERGCLWHGRVPVHEWIIAQTTDVDGTVAVGGFPLWIAALGHIPVGSTHKLGEPFVGSRQWYFHRLFLPRC